ncbi:Protein saf4 [Coemansia biformis]|uniref:Protein saf4 n=1 Tax=Coemansia biformis TaxID=1286918 RepID=A0A9W7YC43_9FUNG|nr:Protein saf4 [Coemansia biformis]
MAERRAVNKYYPPDWDPSKGSVNAHVGQHPLRARARKLDEGILIVRFELPFSVWCGGCGELLATGVRFNAEKTRIGSYFSTPIWSFRMKCRSCSSWFEIHTNPKEATYDVVHGARKKAEPEAQADDPLEIIDLVSGAANSKRSRLHELDVKEARRRREAQTMERLDTLKGASDRRWKDPDATNADLRKTFRVGRRIRDEDRRQSEEIQSRTGIALPILPAAPEDTVGASQVRFGAADSATERVAAAQMAAGRPLFGTHGTSGGTALASKMALRQLGKSDPFAAQPVGQFGPARDLGIRRRTCTRGGPAGGLAELSTIYGRQSPSPPSSLSASDEGSG